MRLHERNAEKRTWKAFQKAQDLHRVDLTSDQLRALLRALGVPIPDSKEALVAALSEGLADGEPGSNRREEHER